MPLRSAGRSVERLVVVVVLVLVAADRLLLVVVTPAAGLLTRGPLLTRRQPALLRSYQTTHGLVHSVRIERHHDTRQRSAPASPVALLASLCVRVGHDVSSRRELLELRLLDCTRRLVSEVQGDKASNRLREQDAELLRHLVDAVSLLHGVHERFAATRDPASIQRRQYSEYNEYNDLLRSNEWVEGQHRLTYLR